MSSNVGFIGLGIMGMPMALNLLTGGYPLWVCDRRAEAAAPLAAAGARVCASPAEAARSVDIIVIMVSDTREVLGRRMVDRDYAPGIEARLHYKDLQIVLNEAHTLGRALPGTALATQTFNALIGRGGGNQDSSQLWEVIGAMSTGAPSLEASASPESG